VNGKGLRVEGAEGEGLALCAIAEDLDGNFVESAARAPGEVYVLAEPDGGLGQGPDKTDVVGEVVGKDWVGDGG
jgi:hypothetical protein